MLKVKKREKTSETLNTMLQLHDSKAFCKAVRSRIDTGLNLQCFPDSQAFWRSIKDTAELEDVVKTAPHKYMELYRTRGKCRDKYASLYRDWLHYQLTHVLLLIIPTTTPKKLWQSLASCHQGDISYNFR